MEYEAQLARLPAKERRLPKTFKAKWLKALRSGGYRQGSGYLVEDISGNDHHCCLGVAADVCGVNGRFGFEDVLATVPFELPDPKRLPSLLLQQYDSAEPNLPTLLSMMNDHGSSFEEIANVIDYHC